MFWHFAKPYHVGGVITEASTTFIQILYNLSFTFVTYVTDILEIVRCLQNFRSYLSCCLQFFHFMFSYDIYLHVLMFDGDTCFVISGLLLCIMVMEWRR